MSEAMEMIKRELGPDAVILKSGKTVDASSGEALFEVQAAIDNNQEITTYPSRDTSGQLKEIEGKIEEIKHFLTLLVSTKEQFTHLHNHEVLFKTYHYLLMQELDEKKIYLLLTRAMKHVKNEKSRKSIIAAFCRELMNSISIIEPFSDINQPGNKAGTKPQPPSIYTFIGPTGVGKTTTLAKLAARLKFTQGVNVGVISFDSYRIGASEQIETYARIMELPFATVQSKEELEFARKQMKDCSVVFVDTTGRNFLLPQHVLELAEVFSNMGDIRHFLVLSATAKDRDLTRTIQQFDSLGIYALIFTKIDETLHHGNVINQLLRFPYPLAYLGTGQRVPEDIEGATKRKLLQLIFPRKEDFC